MANLKCYVTTSLDKQLAEMLVSKGGDKKMTSRIVTSLRALYDEQAEREGKEPLISDEVFDNPTEEKIQEAYEKLLEFKAQAGKRRRERIANGTKRIDRCWDALKYSFDLQQRRDRISMISRMFSKEVDKLMEQFPADRQFIIDGFRTITGGIAGGKAFILEKVYNELMEQRTKYAEDARSDEYVAAYKRALENGELEFANAPKDAKAYKAYCRKRADAYTVTLQNWNELIPFVLKDLVKKEGVKIGIKQDYAVIASESSYGDNNLADTWELSESVREGWQRNSDMESSFGSIGQQVRRILATIPEVEEIPEWEMEEDADGQLRRKFKGFKILPVLDDLGEPRYRDPVKTHQYLVEYLKNCQDSDDMMARLCKDEPGVAKVAWLQPVVDVLYENPQARTQFFADLYKNFQPYSVTFEDKEESKGLFKKIKTVVMNKPLNALLGKYQIGMSSKGKHPAGGYLRGYKYVFGESKGGRRGIVDWDRLVELREKVLDWVMEPLDEDQSQDTNSKNGVFDKIKNYNSMRASYLTSRGVNDIIVVDGEEKRASDAFDDKRDFLLEVFTSLGFDVTVDTVNSILLSNDLYTVRGLLEDLFDPTGRTGFLYAALGANTTEEVRKTVTDANLEKMKGASDQSFWSLYHTAKDTENGKVYPVQKHIEKLLEIVSKHQEGYRVESRVRYQGNTMYSFVAPSYLGDRISAIQSYVEKNDKKGLLDFLKREYLCSSYFVDDIYLYSDGKDSRSKILNFWLAELVEACDENNKAPLIDTVAGIFSFERDLGSNDKKFEDFTTKEHGIDMFVHFFADEEQHKGYGGKGTRDPRKKLSALYPVFILGDAGVSKYIRAPRITSTVGLDEKGNVLSLGSKGIKKIGYSFDENAKQKVVDSFYDIYLQEKRRMDVDTATALRMYANGKEVKHPAGEFSILTFLNDENYKIPQGKEGDALEVKKIIRKYLEDASIGSDGLKKQGRKSFLQRLEDAGVLEQVQQNNKKGYKYISSIATPENIKEKVTEYFWNTKLATAQQLQLMTIDPSFYHGTKDLQKRYKEIHAPGSILDILARNPFSDEQELFSEDGMETMIYFDDIRVNSENTNPEFMEMIVRTFAKQDEGETDTEFIDRVNSLIRFGITVPKTGEAEKNRQKLLKNVLGKDYAIYESYVKNTLTDGQGYRTLTSYRKVMGMAGKWTQTMENAYNTIMSIRRKHEVRDASGKVIDHTDVTAEELKLIAAYALTLQPIKPYMFTHEKYEVKLEIKDPDYKGIKKVVTTQKLIPVQHKYAEAIIIPELMPKGKLRDLGYWMDEHQVDMAGSTKICKVGAFGQAVLDNSSNVSKSDFEESLNQAVIHSLPYKDYRIQTNVPEHINASQLFGTQVRKLIMAGLDLRGGAEFYASLLGIDTVNLSTSEKEDDPNKKAKLNGLNLLALYNSLICANIFDSYDKFAENASDIRMLSDMLQQSTVGSMREAMDNLLSYVVTGEEDPSFLIPLYEGGLEHDAVALILSTFKKIVNKQQISGGSAVQVSAFGINGYSEDGGLRFVTDPDNPGNILYAEIEMPFDKSFVYIVTNADGSTSKRTVDLDYDTYCNTDGTLIPTEKAIPKEIKKDGKTITNPEWKKYQSYTYKKVDGKLVACDHDDPEAEVHKPLIEEEYPDILSILAYRIPTEREYSMLNCQIKRFSPKIAGGTMKVPPEGTTIAGFDFDIDKLYFMQREYRKHYKEKYYSEEHFTDGEKNQIWEKVYKDNPEIYSALSSYRESWIAENQDKIKYVDRVMRSGRVRKVMDEHSLPSLNSFWKSAKITEIYGLDKGVAFSDAAKAKGITPTINVVEDESVEYMESYDFSLPPEKNTRASRNNLLISMIQTRLMDPATVRQRYTPGGFANASDAALEMRILQFMDPSTIVKDGKVDWDTVHRLVEDIKEGKGDFKDPEPNYDPTDPYTILIYNQQNQLAAKLIGIFANQNTNHAFASCMDVFRLKEPIEFCNKTGQDFLHKDDPEKAYEISLNVAEYLAAAVDAVKDPVLNFINLNTVTADAGAVLARLGYTTEEIGLLFNQPIVKLACEETLNRGVKSATAIKDIRKKYKGTQVGESRVGKASITKDSLAKSIISERIGESEGHSLDELIKEDSDAQLAVLDLFEHILQVASDVSDFVMNTKFTAANAVSSTMGGLYAQQMRVDKYVDRFQKREDEKDALSYEMVVSKATEGSGFMNMPITNAEKYTTMSKEEYLRHVRYNPFAFEQTMYDANRRALKLLCDGWTDKDGKHHKGYLPYETDLYKGIRKVMQGMARGNILNEDNINFIHRHIPVALLAKQANSPFDGEAAYVQNGKKTKYTNREFFRDHFAEHLMDRLSADSDLMDLDIFKYLIPTSDVKQVYDSAKGKNVAVEVWKISMQDVGGMDADVKEAIRESWASLMDTDEQGRFVDPTAAQLGRDLFMYCFYQQGFDFSPQSFMHLAPTAVKDNIIVERSESLTPKDYDTFPVPNSKGKPSDDVLVYSPGFNEAWGVDGMEVAKDFGGDPFYTNELKGDSFCMPDKLTAEDIRKLCQEARSHPELKFKIWRSLTEEEFKLFTQEIEEGGEKRKLDVPANIYFMSSTLKNYPEIASEMSYGRNRTYRQFLYEILDGTVGGLNSYEFAKMFALNFPDESKFILNVDYNREGLSKKIEKMMGSDRSKVRIDLTSLSKEELEVWSDFLKVSKEGNVDHIEWVPFFKMGSDFYMANSGFDEFNMTKDLAISYIRVEPWGSSKTIELNNGKKLTPGVQYKSSLNPVEQRGDAELEMPIPVSRQVLSQSPQKAEPSLEELIGDNGTLMSIVQEIEAKVGSRISSQMKFILSMIGPSTDLSYISGVVREQVWPDSGMKTILTPIYNTELEERLVQALYYRNTHPESVAPETSVPVEPQGSASAERVESEEVTNILNAIKERAFQNNRRQAELFNWDAIAQGLMGITTTNSFAANRDVSAVFAKNNARSLLNGSDGKAQWMNLASAVAKRNSNPPSTGSRASSASDAGMTPEDPNERPNNLDGAFNSREEMEDYIIKEFVAGNRRINREVNVEGLTNQVRSTNEKDLEDTIEAIRRACRDKATGVLMLDSDGNLTYGC